MCQDAIYAFERQANNDDGTIAIVHDRDCHDTPVLEVGAPDLVGARALILRFLEGNRLDVRPVVLIDRKGVGVLTGHVDNERIIGGYRRVGRLQLVDDRCSLASIRAE